MAAGGEFPEDYHWICAKCYGGIRCMRSSQNTPTRTSGAPQMTTPGGVSDSVVRQAHCPVLMVRPEKEQAA
jgi:hypothetical protein